MTYTGILIPDLGQLVDNLTYRSYKHQRDTFPDTHSERWEAIYGPQAVQMEERYQRETRITVIEGGEMDKIREEWGK